MSNILFSILVANYNNGHFFKDCYDSIIAQTYQNWECIIVDDGSTDDSVLIIKKIIGDDSRFKLFLNEENRGCGFSKNRCAQLSLGEICGFLDPDDALTVNALHVMIETHQKNIDVAIITSRYEFVDLDMNFLGFSNQGGPLAIGKSYLTDTPGLLTHFASFKNYYFQQTIGIDVRMKRAVDQDLYLKLEEVGKHFFLDQVLYRYRIHKNSISANKNIFKARYWDFYARVKAYERRKEFGGKINNFSSSQIKKIKANYFFERFQKAELEKKICLKYYFFFKSIVVFPRYKIKTKLKYLINKK